MFKTLEAKYSNYESDKIEMVVS